MKKIISFILLITMGLTLTSCEQKEIPEELKNTRVHIANPYINRCFEVKGSIEYLNKGVSAITFETKDGHKLTTSDYIIVRYGSKCPICDKEKGENNLS